MSWDAIASRGLIVRPWSGSLPPLGNRRSQFKAPLGKTLGLLARELRELSAETIVIELAIRERDLRLDGFPRADAQMPEHPAVAVSFESRHGPLRYMTGEYRYWEDNLRAIALSLESLRAVDRYGVSRRGEQYRGWRALTTGSDPAAGMDATDAAAYMEERWGGDFRKALFATHPDHGGDPDEFRKVQRARELLVGG